MTTVAHFPLARRGLVIAAVLALALGACGRRGALETPGAVDPAVQGSVQDSGAATVQAPGPDGEPVRPKRDFLLDAII
jgi:predicted small lipoprotein YifL